MNREIVLGKTADGDVMTVEIALRPLTERPRQTVDHKWVTHEGGKELSICGTLYRKGVKTDAAILSAGQNLDDVLTLTQWQNPWTPDELVELHDIWKRWHLNDMRAGCEHQTKIVYESSRYGRRVNINGTTEANECPVGYKYGSAWLYEPLPDDVIERIHVFQRRLKP